MKNYCDRLGFLTALTVMVTAAPSMAATNKITDLEIDKSNNQLELKLSATNKADASFYTLRGDNTIEANILNTSLDLPEGSSYKQDNPIAGVKALEINQIDGKNTQILISTEANTPVESLLKQEGDDLILTLNRVTKADTLKQEIKEFGQKTVTNLKQSYKSALGQSKDKDNEKAEDSNKADADSDVLIPNPEVVIDDNRVNEVKEKVFTAQDSETELNDSTAPATLPRAAAPPVGDMAVSNINTMPDMVDLGSSAMVSNLVLRDAPVREVLSMLAKTANLSLVYAGGDAAANGDQGNGDGEETGPTISLDLDNQPVQEVFNSVLLISGLDANRRGNIIYVGKQLPAQARNLISRTIRLNQVTAENAALYLASQGAAGKRLTNEVEEIIDPETGKVVQRKETNPELSDLDGGSEDETGTQALMLKGLQVSTDGRLNAITLVGEPRKVEVATSFLTQLDARRRQVSVNVKVIDVNLLNQDVFNSSFSFGINDSFFSQDKGSASLRFGESAPPTTAQLNSPTGRVSNPPVINNPFAGANTFYDFNSTTAVPGASPGIIDLSNSGLGQDRSDANFFNRIAAVSNNPFATGITEFTNGKDGKIEIDDSGNVQLTDPTDPTATSSLPSLFQYPDKFLALLEAKVTSGNAKILTDPTLMVQEGQQGTVKLVQKIVESVKTEIDGDSGARTITPQIGEAGLSLTVNVERIDDNGFVSMSVSPKVSSVGATQTFDSGGGAENILNLLSEREVSSGLVRLRDGQTLILSGIIQDQERTEVSKVPILGDIPLLGALFRSTDKTNERAEVIVLLTPEIVEEDAGLASNYKPSKESREVLEKSGVDVLGK
ncbi:MAG: type II and III secretion system protein [Hyellaceae cyanobacterium CSU_1_1]|nr:type II and III secretion system protein [Hyellaceae cyanobacterium CSU_1_1]